MMKEHYEAVLLDGCALEKGRLSLCTINDYHGSFRRKILYQVHCDDTKVKHSEFYESSSQAVKKFLELKRKIR
jgi:hypothetical protein